MKFFLRERRKELGLTQLQVAQAVGIAESAYQRYELGNSEPLVTTAIRLARALDTSVEKIYDTDD